MQELRLPEAPAQWLRSWAQDLMLQLRRQWVPVLRRQQALSPYGLQTNDGMGMLFTLPWFKLDVAIIDLSTTATATALVRPGLTFAVFAENLPDPVTGLGVIGPTDYDIGTTTPLFVSAWFAGHPIAVENEEDTTPWLTTAAFNVVPPVKYDAPTDIVLTPNGGAFVSGIVKIFALTLDFKPTP